MGLLLNCTNGVCHIKMQPPVVTASITVSSAINFSGSDVQGTVIVGGITYNVYVFKSTGVAYTVNYTCGKACQISVFAVGGGGGGGGGDADGGKGGNGGVGGGGGGGSNGVNPGSGGGTALNSGSAAVNSANGAAGAGGANTGGGGGGAYTSTSGAGGSGITIIAFPQ